MYTVNDFFCGCGGLGLGFKQAGYTIAGSWDFDKYAVQTYKANIDSNVIQADITTMTIADVPYADVWTFGFPCQDLSVAGNQAGMLLKCKECNEVYEVRNPDIAPSAVQCPKCNSTSYEPMSRSGLFFEIMRLLDEAERESQKRPKILMAENVKALRPYLPILEAEYAKRGYRTYYTMYNSKFWGVPQNRERYFVVGVRDDLKGDFIFPDEQHEDVPKLSSILETEVDEKFYISDDKAKVIIEQALNKLKTLGDCHATITPDRINKRQNGPRAKENEKEMFTLTAQDLHGVIIDDTYGYDKGDVRTYTEATPTLRSCRQGVKVIENAITEVVVNDRGFKDKAPQVGTVVPTLRAENHGNHPKVIEPKEPTTGDALNAEGGYIGRKLQEFVEKNGYIPKAFNPWNCKDVTEIAQTVTASCGGTTTTSSILLIERNDNDLDT